MYRKCKSVIGICLVAVVIIVSVLTGSCTKKKAAVPPFIPPEYYEAVMVEPQALLNIYFTGYADFPAIEARYNNVAFVFKDIEVDEFVLSGLDKGFIWVDRIKCYLVNPDDMKRFQLGDRIDVVGYCGGPTQYILTELKFYDCLVLPTGTIAIPADPDSGSISPGY